MQSICSFTRFVTNLPIHQKTKKENSPGITAKGYRASKDKYYYRYKLHTLTAKKVFKQVWGDEIRNKTIFAYKIYPDYEHFNPNKKASQQIAMLTPVKAIKVQSEELKQRYNPIYRVFF